MKFRTAPAGNRELKVTVEMDKDTVDSALRVVAADLAGRIAIPGFRKAKVPLRVLERYVGRQALLAEAHDDLSRQALNFFLDQSGMEEPEHVVMVEVTEDPLAYTFVIALEPYAALSDDYRTLRIEPQDLALTEEEKEAQKQAVCTRLARQEEVDGPIAWDDIIVLDIKGVVLDENLEPTDEVVLEDAEWEVEMAQEYPLGPPNLEQEILGLSVDEAKEFVLTYPEDSESVYAGKSARFAIRVLEISRSTPAPWNAATIIQMLKSEGMQEDGEELTLEECEDILWQAMGNQKAARIFGEELAAGVQLLREAAVVEYADASVRNQIDLLVDQRLHGLTQFGIQDLETYLRYTNQTEDEFRESLREQAETELVHKLLIWEFVRLEDIQIPDDLQQSLDVEIAHSVQALKEMQDFQSKSKAREKLPGADIERLESFLKERRMTETLRRVGEDALVMMLTDGSHSPLAFFEALENDEDPDATPGPVDADASAPLETASPASLTADPGRLQT